MTSCRGFQRGGSGLGVEWGCSSITAQGRGTAECREGEDGAGRARMGWGGREFPRARAELWLSCKRVPSAATGSSAAQHTHGRQRRGSASGWEASLRFPCVFLPGWGRMLPAGHRARSLWGRCPRLPQPARPVPTPCSRGVTGLGALPTGNLLCFPSAPVFLFFFL